MWACAQERLSQRPSTKLLNELDWLETWVTSTLWPHVQTKLSHLNETFGVLNRLKTDTEWFSIVWKTAMNPECHTHTKREKKRHSLIWKYHALPHLLASSRAHLKQTVENLSQLNSPDSNLIYFDCFLKFCSHNISLATLWHPNVMAFYYGTKCALLILFIF